MAKNYRETVFLERETKAKVVFGRVEFEDGSAMDVMQRWIYIYPDEWDSSGKSEGWALISDIHRPAQPAVGPVRVGLPPRSDPEASAPHDDSHTTP